MVTFLFSTSVCLLRQFASLPATSRLLNLHFLVLLRCRKIFSDEKGKLEEADFSNALVKIAAEHNSVKQTNTAENKA